MKIVPKNWTEFQHYSNRNPPWVKLHHSLLDNRQFQSLSDASRALAPMLWLIASEHRTGEIDANPSELAFRLRKSEKWIGEALEPLIREGFFLFADTALAECKQSAMPERETERETETENYTVPLTRDDAKSKRKAQSKTEALQYLDFLNAKAGKHFRPVPSNLRSIEARLAEGISLQDLKTLTLRKCREWLGTDMEKFLRPETLCNATKCNSYLGEIAPEESCNAQVVTGSCEPMQEAVPADGNCLTRSEKPNATQRMETALGPELRANADSRVH